MHLIAHGLLTLFYPTGLLHAGADYFDDVPGQQGTDTSGLFKGASGCQPVEESGGVEVSGAGAVDALDRECADVQASVALLNERALLAAFDYGDVALRAISSTAWRGGAGRYRRAPLLRWQIRCRRNRLLARAKIRAVA